MTGPRTPGVARGAADFVAALVVAAGVVPGTVPSAVLGGGPGLLAAQEPSGAERFTQTIPGTDVSFEMVRLPAGTFRLGSPSSEPGRDADEGPVRSVRIDGLWMSTTEVTYDVFSVFRDRRLDTPDGPAPGISFDVDAVSRPSPPYEDPAHGMSGPGRPATGMTRLAALHFARWLSEKTGRLYRLPTEAEWEYACRGGGEGPWGRAAGGGDVTDAESAADGSGVRGGPDPGAALGDVAWYEANTSGAFHPVALKEANPWGVHDLLGNVAEWTADPYDAEFYASIAEDGTASNPSTGPSARGRGVVRGGAFDDAASGLRCADRFEETPAWKRRDPQIPKSRWWNTDSPHVGLRLVSPAVELTRDDIRAYWSALLGDA